MLGRDFFKDSSGIPVRVVDLCAVVGKEARKEPLNTFDKEMSSVLLNLRYDEALRTGSEQIAALGVQLYESIDKAYTLFHDYILFNESQKIDQTNRDTITGYLKLIHIQIQEAKATKIHPRELLNLALIKLAMLRDWSKNESKRGFEEMTREVNEQSEKSLSVNEYIERFLKVPLTGDLKVIKQLLGSGICSPFPFENYANMDTVLPIFSKSGSVGINTILYALYNGYYPVGFGVEPHTAHLNVHEGVIENMRHDLGHNFLRVYNLRIEAPEQFEAYKNAYQQTVIKRYNQKIDNLTFKKNLLALFLLTWEIRFYPMQIQPAVAAIRVRNIIDLIDFIKPLRSLGYPVISNVCIDSYVKNGLSTTVKTFFDEKNRVQESIIINLISLLDDFKISHPEVGLDLLADLNDGNLAYAKALFQNPQYINKVSAYCDRIVLHFVCERGQVLIAKELLDRGADKNAVDRIGSTPLHLACENGNLELAKLLLSFGADLNAKRKNGSSPLDLAFKSGNPELVLLLLSSNVSSYIENELDSKSFCPIM